MFIRKFNGGGLLLLVTAIVSMPTATFSSSINWREELTNPRTLIAAGATLWGVNEFCKRHFLQEVAERSQGHAFLARVAQLEMKESALIQELDNINAEANAALSATRGHSFASSSDQMKDFVRGFHEFFNENYIEAQPISIFSYMFQQVVILKKFPLYAARSFSNCYTNLQGFYFNYKGINVRNCGIKGPKSFKDCKFTDDPTAFNIITYRENLSKSMSIMPN